MKQKPVLFYTFDSFHDSLNRAGYSLAEFIPVFEKYDPNFFTQNRFNSHQKVNEYLLSNIGEFNLFKRRMNSPKYKKGSNSGLRLFYSNYFTENEIFVFLMDLQSRSYFTKKNKIISYHERQFLKTNSFLKRVENSDYFGNCFSTIDPNHIINLIKEAKVNLDFLKKPVKMNPEPQRMRS